MSGKKEKREAPKRAALEKIEAEIRSRKALPGDYLTILSARAEAYAEHIAGMTVDQQLNAWAERMTARFGPKVKVWHAFLPWIEALLVVRYGEAVEHWPDKTTAADLGRAHDWELGREEPHAVARARTMTLEGA